MPDRNGWLTRDEAASCGKPLYITGGPGWRPERPKGWAILPKYRCAELKAHVEATEQPIAYLMCEMQFHLTVMLHYMPVLEIRLTLAI